MTEAQFKVGDRVRVKDGKHPQSFLSGEEFMVTGIRQAPTGSRYYEGDRGNFGVWEKNLEFVTGKKKPTFTFDDANTLRNESLEFMKSWITDNLETHGEELTEIPFDSKTYHYTLGIIHSYRDVLQSIDEELEEEK